MHLTAVMLCTLGSLVLAFDKTMTVEELAIGQSRTRLQNVQIDDRLCDTISPCEECVYDGEDFKYPRVWAHICALQFPNQSEHAEYAVVCDNYECSNGEFWVDQANGFPTGNCGTAYNPPCPSDTCLRPSILPPKE